LPVQWLVQINFAVYFSKAQWQSFEASGFHLKPNYLPYVQLYVVYPLMINVGSVNHLHFLYWINWLYKSGDVFIPQYQ